MSPETIATLKMLRRVNRPIAPRSHTKRPTGGRPNPCAEHREPSHPLAAIVAANAGRPNRRRQQLRKVIEPGWKLVSRAIQDGSIPVGVPITEAVIVKAIPYKQVSQGVPLLALSLAQHREPVRLVEIGNNKWIARVL